MTIVYDKGFPINNLKELPKGVAFILEEKESKSADSTVFIKDDNDIVVSLRGTCYTSASFKVYYHEIVRVAISPIILPTHKYDEIRYRCIEDIKLGEMFIHGSQIYVKCRYIDNTECAYNLSKMDICFDIPMGDQVIWAPFLGIHAVKW